VRARTVVFLLLGVLGFYLALVGWRGVLLVQQGGSVPVLLGLAVLAVPVIGAYAAWREVRFGLATQRLARELETAGHWPKDDLPVAPSGRAQRAAADALFERRRLEVQQSPADWQAWFRLGLAYEHARDRRRARQSMRRAIALHG
jgi:Flp pilus assembly protein TadD